MNNKYLITAVSLLVLPMGSALADAKFDKMMKDSFQSKGVASVDRLNQDDAQKYCSDPATLAGKGDPKRAEVIQKANMATIKQPASGKYIGDWKTGERVAQSGRGATWSDKAGAANGGGCYNCHQINKAEVSYGNIGPSLWNYGKLRGYGQEVVTYTWNRINNSKAYNVCSNMPRFGHFNLLTEKQMQDVMALLLDTNSPVNQ